MVKIKTYMIRRDGTLPADCPIAPASIRRAPVALEAAEIHALEAAGVWPHVPGVAGPSSSSTWTRQAPDGSVWAGAELEAGKMIAKVRGKGGRRLGQGRYQEPCPDSRKVTSVSFAPEVKGYLERKVAAGGAESLSAYLEALVRQDMAAGASAS